ANSTLTDMGLVSGWMNLIPFIVSGFATGIMAGNSYLKPDIASSRKLFCTAAGIGSGVLIWRFTMLANLLLGSPVAGAVATLMMAILWLLYIRRGRLTPGLGRSLVPYLILLIGTIVGQIIYRTVELGARGEVLASPALWLTP